MMETKKTIDLFIDIFLYIVFVFALLLFSIIVFDLITNSLQKDVPIEPKTEYRSRYIDGQEILIPIK